MAVAKKPKLLALSILVTQIFGTIGAVFTLGSVNNWYPSLVKPTYIPPDYIFGPVWIVLYTLMGISLYFVLLKFYKDPHVKFAVILYFLHVALNGIWSFLFFGLQQPLLALIEIVVLYFVVLFIVVVYYRIDKRASLVLIPYLIWIGFALYLNYQIWRLN